jgi:hypothetical protein
VQLRGLLVALAACRAPDQAPSDAPLLWVEETLSFETVDIGSDEPPTERLWVENIGTGTLAVETPYFAYDSAFSVSGASVELERMEAYPYEVTFDPQSPFLHEALLIIDSDDRAAGGRWAVTVRGEALAPVLEIAATPLDLGAEVGCAVFGDLGVRNGGNEVLVVTPRLDSASPTELFLASDAGAIEIEAGMAGVIELAYQPSDTTTDSATLIVDSNDPFLPEMVIEVTGAGHEWETRTDVFEMPSREADIVLVVDDSGTMDFEQLQLADHVGWLVDGLDAAMVDYRIGVIATDQSSFYGPVVTPGTTSPVDQLVQQVTVGTEGSGTTRALQMLYNCVQSASDCSETGGFLRENALFAGIIVSDGPDQSALTPEGYVEYLWELKDDPGLVRIHAIAGSIPVPTCGTCASPGFGYDQAVELTGGRYVDICTNDWDVALRSLGEDSVGAPSTGVTLDADPLVDTIEVDVDGVRWKTGWIYTGHVADGGTNEVRFDLETLPPVGATVEVRYTVASTCK